VRWVYNNSLPEKGCRRAGFLFPAACRFNARTLLFDREELERIIEAQVRATQEPPNSAVNR
jgi:hypothetical protein